MEVVTGKMVFVPFAVSSLNTNHMTSINPKDVVSQVVPKPRTGDKCHADAEIKQNLETAEARMEA
jgi:hypothetical protein